MERLTMESNKGGVALTFDLDVTCEKSEMLKILKMAEKLKEYEDLEEQGKLLRLPVCVGDKVYILKNVEVLRNYVVQIHISQTEPQTFFQLL